jgi:hypothetical protein
MEHRAEYVYLWWLSFVFIKGFFNRAECIKIVLIYPSMITVLFILHLSLDCAKFIQALYLSCHWCLPFHRRCSIVASSISLVSCKYVLFYFDEWFHVKNSIKMWADIIRMIKIRKVRQEAEMWTAFCSLDLKWRPKHRFVFVDNIKGDLKK